MWLEGSFVKIVLCKDTQQTDFLSDRFAFRLWANFYSHWVTLTAQQPQTTRGLIIVVARKLD